MATDWHPDVLGPDFEATTLALTPDWEGDVVATVVRAGPPSSPHGGAVLYLHGFNDYFFQVDLARWYTARGWAFYALDLRKYGRSLRSHQTPNFCSSLDDYDEELDAAAALIAAEGHQRLLLTAHSTGGLILPLWAARRPSKDLAGLILNSPFLEFKQSPALGAVVLPLARLIGRYRPTGVVPTGVNGLYGEGLHANYRGEWVYNLAWKPLVSFPVRFAWLTAVAAGHRRVRAGLGLSLPVLAMSSTHTISSRTWTPDLQRGDVVLDADRIAQRATSLGLDVTTTRVLDGMHDLVLSPPPARERAYAAMANWLDERVS